MVLLYKHLSNETIVNILMFSFFWFIDIEVLYFIFIVKKEKYKVLKFDLIYFPYFEIGAILFWVLSSFNPCPLISTARTRFELK